MAKILLAEDDWSLRRMIELSLELLGHTVIVANDGQEAIDRLTVDTDLIITDFRMPKLDGHQIVYGLGQKIISFGRFPPIPIIVMSGGDRPTNLSPEIIFIAKPFELEEMMKIINKFVS